MIDLDDEGAKKCTNVDIYKILLPSG